MMGSGVCASATRFWPFHFTGKERDTESGNDYFGARYYSSLLGRFISPDWSAKEEPVPYSKLVDPQTLNLYSYVQNNPITRFDVDGHCDAPSGLQPGQVGICIASYIRTQNFKRPGKGDDRDASAFSGTSRVEERFIVDADTGMVAPKYKYVGSSGVFVKDFGPQGKGFTHFSDVKWDSKNKTFDIQVVQHAESWFSGKTLGFLAGTIDSHLNLKITGDRVLVEPGSTARDFPSLEGWSYTIDADGKITAKPFLNKVEASHDDKNGDLSKPEKPIKPSETR